MLLSETIWKHLAEVDEECNEMMDRIVRQMAKSEGVTERLKSDDWLFWLQKMNNIRSRAEEIALRLQLWSGQGGTKFPHCITNANGGILKKSKTGLDRTEEKA